MRQIKFSLIVPMYNIENYIEKCIKSILEQSYTNFEIIIVDDGSTDNSYEVVKKYKSEKVKIIRKKNGGLSDARNAGMKHITGDYIWFIDGDDYIEKDALQILYNKVQEKEYDVVSFSYFYDYGNKKIEFNDRMDGTLEKQLPLISNSACSKIYKKEFYLKNNFEFLYGKIYEDLALIPFVLVKAKEVAIIKDHIYNYVQRQGSIMNFGKKFKTNRDDKFDALDKLYSLFKNDNLYDKYKEELEYLAIRHLILVYSSEILPFARDIYAPRCERVLKYLENINKKWYNNKYIKKSSKLTRIYVYMFKMKCFHLCKIALKFKKM